MPVTVGDIVAATGEGVTLRAGSKGSGRPVRWVHVSELEDPTPWLKGGELLLTTGMALPRTPAGQRRYLERLEAAGIAGLGLGTGFSFSSVPKSLRTAADNLGFPLLEVPFSVPFIAITEAVFSRLHAEEVDVLRKTIEIQAEMTDAVLKGGGATGVSRVLARAVGGWAVVLDLHGLPIGAWPENAAARAMKLWDEVRGVRPDAPGSSVSLSENGHRIAVQPVGVGGRVDGFLVLGTRHRMGQLERLAASHALSLLAIEFDKNASIATAERRFRGDLLDALVSGSLSEADASAGLARFGFRPSDRVRVVALDPGPVLEPVPLVEEIVSRLTPAFLSSPREDAVVLLVPEGADPNVIRDAVASRLGAQVMAGIGSPVAPIAVSRSVREARHALRIAAAEGKPIADFRSLGTYRLLLTLQDPDALRAFADAVLDPLDRYDSEHGGELISSLRAFLEHNARWEAAAAALYVHRHTLRYRMRKVEELTGRDLDSSRDRMEFWLALQGRDLLSGGTDALS
ncbi:MAG TPA: PucR family transcriptional regulator ligand-binding domain-containing protein [Actinomycetota bacterium]|nr:PucR family transcriptional regulator ligand-binding domain-containing protein [Actinomycetota bacterium]